MSSQVLTWVLGILATILGGTNLVTIVQLRSVRAKGNYEAESVQIKNLNTIIDLTREEVQRLSSRLKAQEEETEAQKQKTSECGKRCEEQIAALQEQHNKFIESLRAANLKGLNL